jgi:SagB-type dehydrogenase family enzyme
MPQHVGDNYQQETKYHRDRMRGGGMDWSKQPEAFKSYPGAKTVQLELPREFPKATLWETLERRRSIRDYADVPMTKSELSQLLWAAQGVTARAGGYLFRTAPSAGALYPVETYVVVNHVTDMPRGIYHYDVRNHRLELIREGDFREAAARAALDQEMLAAAAVVFIWTAIFARSAWKYGERAYRYVYLDAGHVAQNVTLAAVALGFGSCQIGALYDDEVNALVGADGTEESTLYMTSVGRAEG